LTGDTVIATVDGPRTFAELAEDGRDVQVYSWHPDSKLPVIRMMRNPHRTAQDVPVLEIEFDSGLSVRCTPDHGFYSFRGKRIEARDLKVGKSVRAWSMSQHRDGHLRVHGWDSKRNAAVHQWVSRMMWESEIGAIPEGMVIDHINGDCTDNRIENFQILTEREHNSKHYPERFANGFDGKARNHKVVAIREAGRADVYNGMVEDSHTYIILDPEPIAGISSGIVSANCGEICLEPWENCNLGHINLAMFINDHGETNVDELYRAHELMTRFLIRATNGDTEDPKQKEVLARNRRIGVGHLGVASYLAMRGLRYDVAFGSSFSRLLADLAGVVDKAAASYSHALRIPVPVKTRTVAPTGTIAKMPGVSEGIHPIFAKYFIRRIRFSTLDPDQVATLKQYEADGYHVEDCLYAPNTRVAAIPTMDTLMVDVAKLYGVESAERIVQSADEISLEAMLAFQAQYQELWADNAVSYTVNISPGMYSAEHVASMLRAWGPRLKGATLFPDKSIAQSPYERLTREEFELFANTAVADSVDEACTSGACPIR
jgi:ribonucleotide reductase alpha subunit